MTWRYGLELQRKLTTVPNTALFPLHWQFDTYESHFLSRQLLRVQSIAEHRELTRDSTPGADLAKNMPFAVNVKCNDADIVYSFLRWQPDGHRERLVVALFDHYDARCKPARWEGDNRRGLL